MSEFMKGDTTGSKDILVTGGAGYVGTHTIVCLLAAGYNITVVDNLVNSSEEGLNRVRNISGCDASRIKFFNVDLCDENALETVFKQSPRFLACIHCAALKAVGESVRLPLLYYQNNLSSTFTLLALMDKYECRSIVFSSSATVYGSAAVPITEETQTGIGINNAYGRTKYMIEEILNDFHRSKLVTVAAGSTPPAPFSVVILRYFNPVGSHISGDIGEDPNGIPNNLMPFVAQVVVGRRAQLTVFGNDYDTKDGTGVRDYIHVMDVAEGHVSALAFLQQTNKDNTARPSGYGKYSVFNLGTGIGYSVIDMIEAMKRASGRPLPYEFGPRREGDIATCYASVDRAKELLGWEAKRSLEDMCRDLWNWQSKNPNGYAAK